MQNSVGQVFSQSLNQIRSLVGPLQAEFQIFDGWGTFREVLKEFKCKWEVENNSRYFRGNSPVIIRNISLILISVYVSYKMKDNFLTHCLLSWPLSVIDPRLLEGALRRPKLNSSLGICLFHILLNMLSSHCITSFFIHWNSIPINRFLIGYLKIFYVTYNPLTFSK